MICGTRGSDLAIIQTRLVMDALRRAGVDAPIDVKVVETAGDRSSRTPGTDTGGVGAFVREIDSQLVSGEIDFAVHSFKDVPTEPRRGVETVAALRRANPRDYLVARQPLSKLPMGATVGTSSPRRRAQLLRLRPDICIVPLRGNVPTRIRKVYEQRLDGGVVAKAGLDRLGMGPVGHTLPLRDFVPAPAQGVIVATARTGSEAASVLRKVNHGPSMLAAEAERTVMRALGGGCATPIGIYAAVAKRRLGITAMILSPNGAKCLRHSASFPLSSADEGIRKFGEALRREGGDELVRECER